MKKHAKKLYIAEDASTGEILIDTLGEICERLMGTSLGAIEKRALALGKKRTEYRIVSFRRIGP